MRLAQHYHQTQEDPIFILTSAQNVWSELVDQQQFSLQGMTLLKLVPYALKAMVYTSHLPLTGKSNEWMMQFYTKTHCVSPFLIFPVQVACTGERIRTQALSVHPAWMLQPKRTWYNTPLLVHVLINGVEEWSWVDCLYPFHTSWNLFQFCFYDVTITEHYLY